MLITEFSRFLAKQKNFFYLNIKFLCYVGLWAEDNWPKNIAALHKIYELTLNSLCAIFVILTGIGSFQHKDDTIVLLSNLDKTLVAYNYGLKTIFFLMKRDRLKVLINDIIYSGDELSELCRKKMIKHVLVITTFTVGIMGGFTLFAMYRIEMPIETWLPFDATKNRVNLSFACQVIAGTLMPLTFRSNAMQGILCSMVMYLCEQLEELQVKIINLKYTPDRDRNMREEFREIVKKHIRLLEYSNELTSIFNEYFLIQNFAVTLEMCLNILMVTVVCMVLIIFITVYATLVRFEQMELLLSFFACLTLALLNAYIYCYLGNELIIQSQGIASALYESEWTSWPLDLQKNLAIMITVAQRPFKLSAGGLSDMSIETYSQTLYNGYSIFAVLNDVVD